MKRITFVAVLLFLVFAVLFATWSLRDRPVPQPVASRPRPGPTPAAAPSPVSTSPKPTEPPPVPANPAPASAPRVIPRPPPQQPNPARVEAEDVALNLRHFGQRFGGNPVGTNAEIARTLNGGNPQGVRYLPQQHLRLNDQGELLDFYGTPYFFHQISAQEMEIRSAGPDKTMWTPDDIVVK
ncbi:MAG: hypothetical protein U1F71_10705 [Verrucomicrobiaceae bacterium]